MDQGSMEIRTNGSVLCVIYLIALVEVELTIDFGHVDSHLAIIGSKGKRSLIYLSSEFIQSHEIEPPKK